MKAVIFIHVLYLILIKTLMVKGVSKCESKVELRAVLLSCPTKDNGCDDDDLLSQVIKSEESQILQADSKNFDSLREEKEKGFSSAVKDCKRKLVITLKLKNSGKIPCDDEYIVVDHVFDPVTGGRGRLLSPVVLKLRQEQMTHLYGLQFQRVVNGDPFEEEMANGKTCSVSPENPTCGIAMYDGKPISFSEGFCCSCNPHENAKRQLTPMTRKDSILYRDYKTVYQGSPHFLHDEKAAIIDPNLIKLKRRSLKETAEEKKSGLGDPLSWDKIPNYLLEHDRKVICDRGDFMNELCKLQEEKYYAESSLSQQYHSKGDERERDKKSDGIRSNVEVEEVNLKKRDLATIEIDVDANKENLLKGEQGHNVILVKDFIKKLNMDQITGAGTLSDNYNSAKGSRGKRENRNENKKLTLEEKLEKFVNSKSHLSSTRKRLLELSHKRSRKAAERCLSSQAGATVVEQELPQTNLKFPPPKYFFFHDKFIIDPVETLQMMTNSSCELSKELPYEEAKDKTFELLEKNLGKTKNEIIIKGKEKNMLRKIKNEEKVFKNEGGKIGHSIGRGESRIESLKESLKLPSYMAGNERYGSFKRTEENKGNSRETDFQTEKKPTLRTHHKEQKISRLSCKSLKNLFHKCDSNEKLRKPQKIRNFFMAKNRERQKLNSELDKGYKKIEENDSFKCKNSNKEEKNAFDDKFQEKEPKEVEKGKKSYMNQQEGELQKKSSETLKEIGKCDSYPNSSMYPSSKKTNILKKKKKYEETDEIQHRVIGKDKTEKEMSEENIYSKQSSEKIMGPSRSRPSKELTGNTDFSFEIIRHKCPEHIRARQHWSFKKPNSNNRKSVSPPVFDAEASNLMRKYNHLKKKRLQYKYPQKYYIPGSEISPHHTSQLQNDQNPFKDVKVQQYYLNEKETDFQPEPEPVSEPEPEPGFGLYGSAVLSPEYKSFLQKKSLLHHSFPKYDDELPRHRKTFLPNHENKLISTQLRGKRFSELLHRGENGYLRIGYRPELVERELHPRFEKVRSKRDVSFSFQPAKGFFRSEFDSRNPEDRILHELQTCLSEPKVKKSENFIGRTSRSASRQPLQLKHENLTVDANGISTYQRLLTGLNCPPVTLREKAIKSEFDKQRLIQSYLNAPDYVLEEVEAALKGKRQTTHSSRTNCSREEEEEEEEEDTQDTAHCMRFGDMWYRLYAIKKPVISQIVGIQLFDKHLLWDGTSQWRDLTKGKMIRVGTFLPKAEDELPTISVNFIGENTKKAQTAIDPDNYYLLVPSHLSNPYKMNLYPQFDGGPAEYLLVPSKDVSSGGECNMVGTSFEAFSRQPERCNQRKGSCLKRQPVDLWREDMEARIRGKRGKYFVENFGTVPNSSVKTYSNIAGEFLALEYYGEYTSTIEIEVKADSNAVVRKGSNAQIPLVYIDSTYPKKTRIILSVLNIGLTSSYFRPRLGDCPPDLDPAWCPLEGPLVTIPPQQRHDFKLDLSGVLPARQIFVSVQVLNQVNKKIASRKISIKKEERCVCAFHCKCNCIGSSTNDRACRRLSLKDYRKAGYIGSFPFRGGTPASGPEKIWKNIHIVLLTASYVLLLLGFLKGIVGVFVRRIGIAGLRIITGPRELCGYYESELQGCSVLFDEYGFPVHPTTCQPVQIVPLWLETIMNFFFFFLYPLRGLWFLLLSLPCCKAISSECDGCGEHNEGDSDQKCSRPLLSKGISPTCVHYNLTTINSKKSKQDEYLPYPAYKGDDDPLEEDDTEFVLQEMKRHRKE